MSDASVSLSKNIEDLPKKLALKARSLLVTVWGDSIAPHGGTVWLGSLIDLVAPFGLNERAVRTSVFRLKNEKTLSSFQEGRRSFYTLTASGQHRFEEATKRIYNHMDEAWDGEWTLLFSERRKLEDDIKKQLSLELGWLGFGDLGSGIYAHPNCERETVERLVSDLDISSHVAFMKANGLSLTDETQEHILVQKGWNLSSIEDGYTDFITHFKPIINMLRHNDNLTSEQSFTLRTLLVHDYRRALLRDPMLPSNLLPESWNGNTAKELFHDIYQIVWQDAETHLLQTLETKGGKLPDASTEFSARFGGLK
ncbi:MAG: phenylacetic acid degradation operon negative regulatory protein PaaX [Pseudomonas marincola]